MKATAAQALRLLADQSESPGGQKKLSDLLASSLIGHLAVDLNMSREAIMGWLEHVYDVLEPGIAPMREAISKLDTSVPYADQVDALVATGATAILKDQLKS